MLPNLRVSGNGRFLETVDGRPFFYLADTAWELFHRLDRAETLFYLNNRADKGFNVVQSVILAQSDGLNVANAYGDLPLIDGSPERPNEAYFSHVDWVVRSAAKCGLYSAILPTWGDKWFQAHGVGPEVFTLDNAAWYGRWLGERYREESVIWVLGGDRSPQSAFHFDLIRSMAHGIREGSGGHQLMTYHSSGDAGSAEFFHSERWLDFNARQNGHEVEYDRYGKTLADWRRLPTKPVFDIEPIYEDIEISLCRESAEYSCASDVRRAFYWDVFSGACGHAYGHHSVWQMYQKGRKAHWKPLMDWRIALDQPGAAQMGIGRRLIESRPMGMCVPADEILQPSPVVPGNGRDRFVAQRSLDGSFAMVYVPVGRDFEVNLDCLSGPCASVSWFDPRTGSYAQQGRVNTGQRQRFISPTPGERLDWVLVLDRVT